jgi:ketosteroid isomerase-like protein
MNGAATFAEAFLSGDAAGAAALLDEDVTFHSPVRDYHGRERVAAVLAMVTRVLGRGSVEAVLEGADGETATFFTAQVGGGTLEGVLRVRAGSDITLMARPLRVLLPAVEELAKAAP